MNREHSDLIDEAERHGCAAHIERRGKHDALVITKGTRSRFVTISRTTGDHRAHKNRIGDVRRTVRELAN